MSVTADPKAANKQVIAAIKRTKEATQELDTACRSALASFLAHGQSGPIVRLMTELKGTGLYLVNLKKWFEDHGNLSMSLDKESGAIVVKRTKNGKDIPAADAVDKATKVPSWLVYVQPDPFKGFDLQAKFEALKKEAEKYRLALLGEEIKIKGEVRALTQHEREMIKLDGWDKIMGSRLDLSSDVITLN